MSYDDWKRALLQIMRDQYGWNAVTISSATSEKMLHDLYDLGFGVTPAVTYLRSSVR